MNRRGILPLITLFVLLLSACHEKEVKFFLGGIQVAEPNNKEWVEALEDSDFNTVAVTVYAKQGDWDGDNFWHNGIDSNVIQEIQVAKKEGLKVVLILRVALDHAFPRNRFLWHGMILPRSEEKIRSWFKKYNEFVSLWAQIAEEEDIDVLGIGSELKEMVATVQPHDTILEQEYEDFVNWEKKHSQLILRHGEQIQEKHLWVRGENNFTSLASFLDQKVAAKTQWAEQVYYLNDTCRWAKVRAKRNILEEEWLQLIKHLRTQYQGKLVYASNFDNYHRTTIWKDLDFIGLNAYFKLQDLIEQDTIESVDERLYHSWNQVFDTLQSFKTEHNYPQKILFTELGYTYRKNCTIAPWAHDEFSVLETADTSKMIIWYEQPEDHSERYRAIQQLYRVNLQKPLLKGILYWKLSTDLGHKRYEDFLLHIGKESQDSLLTLLPKFCE